MKKLITSFIALILPLFVSAQSYRLYSSDGELSSTLINAIYQDHLGLVWIATEDGLTKYDGVKFTTYKHIEGDDHSLAHNLVRCISEDKQGHLFVGTHFGLQCFDRARNRFTTIAKDDKGTILSGNVNKILQLSNGEVWASGNDLFRAVLEGDELMAKETNFNGPHNNIQDIQEDKFGNIWVANLHNGVFVSRKKSKTVKHYLGDLKGVGFERLVTDENGNVFVGTNGSGVLCFNKTSEKFDVIPGTEDFLTSALQVYDTGVLLIGSDGSGLYTYNINSKTLQSFPLENKFFNSQRAKIHAIMTDSDGDLWLGVFQKGVMFVKNKSNSFQTIGHRTFSGNIIGTEAVTGITQDSSGRMWISTDNDGVYALSENGDSPLHFSHAANAAFPSLILGISADSKNRIWVASYTDGLGYFTSNGQYVKYPLYAADNGREVGSVMAVLADKQGRIWAATLGNNIYCIDTNTDKLIPGCCQIANLDNWQCALALTKSGLLCVGTFNGCYGVEVKNAKAKVTGRLIESNIVYSICDDRNGGIWMGTSNGLCVYNEQTKKVKTYTTADGLPSNTVYGVRCGSSPYVWASTTAGLFQFGLDGVHKANFSIADGLQGNEFSKGATFTDNKGRFWFGGNNGVTFFSPSEMVAPENKWEIRVTDFFLNNKPVNTETKSGFWKVVDTDVIEAKRFDVGPNDNSFTIEFGIRQLNVLEGQRYEYTVNDGNPELLPYGVHGITFSNLSHGTYNIKVYVHGYPDVNVCEVVVKVHTVWYNHWLMWVVYIVCAIFLCYMIWRHLKKKIDTEKALYENQRRNEINQSKLQLFTNISHEIRTPMTLIISPLEKLMNDDSDVAYRKRSYGIMHKNASRILTLVNQLMDIRKIEHGKMQMDFSVHDIIPIIGNICESFVESAAERDVTFTYIHDGIDKLFAEIDIRHFDKIVSNLVSNAMKFTKEHGVVTVAVSRLSDERFEISVSDNGIGIPDSEKVNIFNRFYQVKSEKMPDGNNYDHLLQATGGTGVGLHLAHALVEMHGGTIRVEDNIEGNGSSFVVELPSSSKETVEESVEVEQTPAPVGVADTLVPESSPSRQQIQTSYRVLIVDDDADIADYINQELSSRYHCSVCHNGKDALDQILKNPPHLVISDVLMPEMSGIELTKRIKANVNINHIPVILVTALSDTQSNVEGLNVGAAAYLTKPFNVTLLKTTVDNIIKSRQRLKNVYEGKQTVDKKLPKVDMLSPDERLMRRVMKIVEAHIFDHKLTVDFLASEAGISRVHLNRKLKEMTNQTTTDFIKNIRLKRAAELLSQKKHSIAEVADMVGFQNANNFSTAFRKLYGMSPREYMMKNN